MRKSIQFKGAECFYKVKGKGKTLVLLHGFIEEGSMWNELAKSLSKKYQLIIPDLPGFGKSQLPSSPISMELYAELVFEILKGEKLKSVIMFGHSMGGYIALHFAEKHENMLQGLGLINSHCFADTDSKKENRKKGIEHMRRYGTKTFVRELYLAIFHDLFKKKNPLLINSMIKKAQQYSVDALTGANTAMMNRRNKSEVLKNMSVPVLLISGKEDETVPLELTLKQASFANATDFHLFKNSKHMTVFEHKKEVIKIIGEFCRRA